MTAQILVLYPPGLDRDFDHALAELGFGMNPAALLRHHRRAALRLNTLDDVALRVLGITRADIPAYVMRHRFPAFAARVAFRAANS
ncbi:hypothetical protein [Mangrovicoccus algicola]|uniref:DUF1127 domain-containing protein n=1 Tax=Mangrovicoccus algicola TaxID=2771008 RepID=A0A8J7CZY3_9RHOB|nr:hypothetical protein [Mangrovicoccus algicola]MBE3638638.1 hypothetical protein [Mangrovicoccus algicola]